MLLGEHERHDTTQAPQSVTDAHQSWITRYLNGRFRRLPVQVEVLVREQPGRREPGQLRRIDGEHHYLEQHAVAAGTVEFTDAIVLWWALDDDHRGRRREAGIWAASGHADAVADPPGALRLPAGRGGSPPPRSHDGQLMDAARSAELPS